MSYRPVTWYRCDPAPNHRLSWARRFEQLLEATNSIRQALRAGRKPRGGACATVKNGEIFLFGAQITPLIQASSHVVADDRRTRKLLLHRHEIDKLVGKVERESYTLIPTAAYWKSNKVKLELALAKGKQSHDKRAAEKDRDWAR